jgi:hypothetical protein
MWTPLGKGLSPKLPTIGSAKRGANLAGDFASPQRLMATSRPRPVLSPADTLWG